MSNVLIRGLPEKAHQKIKRLAKQDNLSLNQAIVRLIVEALEELEKKREREDRRAEAFRRIEELREKIRREHGTFDESWKLIREDRDSR